MSADDHNGQATDEHAPIEVEADPEETEAVQLDPEERARREAALAQVRKLGDPVLKTRALEVSEFDDELREQVARMAGLMVDSWGIGLAATQLGVLNRVLVYRVGHDAPVAALVNPELVWSGKEMEGAEEGCLSIPGVVVEVERPVNVRVRGLDERGAPLEVEASGLEARVLQHEMDHLDGVLILDRCSRDERKRAMRELREAQEARAA
jgi:peptide deformylase